MNTYRLTWVVEVESGATNCRLLSANSMRDIMDYADACGIVPAVIAVNHLYKWTVRIASTDSIMYTDKLWCATKMDALKDADDFMMDSYIKNGRDSYSVEVEMLG